LHRLFAKGEKPDAKIWVPHFGQMQTLRARNARRQTGRPRRRGSMPPRRTRTTIRWSTGRRALRSASEHGTRRRRGCSSAGACCRRPPTSGGRMTRSAPPGDRVLNRRRHAHYARKVYGISDCAAVGRRRGWLSPWGGAPSRRLWRTHRCRQEAPTTRRRARGS
jgi:hypothetical protein